MRALGQTGIRPWLLASVSIALCAGHASPVKAETRTFDVEAQAAGSGLRRFARQAGIQIIASGHVVKGKSVNALSGRYTVAEGLTILLQGSGLEAVGSPPDIVVIRPIARVPVPDMMPEETIIVVTAQRRLEPLQNVPASVQVASGTKIEQQAVGTYKGIIQMFSGVTVREHSDPRSVGLIVRGVGSNQSFTGIEPDAAVNIDGEVMSRSSVLFYDVNDIESAAILKGPQGTLFGKNSVAGVLQIRTRRPNLAETSGKFKLSLDQGTTETFGDISTAATYNQVLSDNAAVRLNVFQKRDSGWVENVRGGPNGGQSEGYGGRIQYLHRFGEDTELIVRTDYQQLDFGPSTRVYLQRDDLVVGDEFGQIPQSVIDGLGLSPEALQRLLTTDLHLISQTPAGRENRKTSASGVRDYGGTRSFGVSAELTRRLSAGHDVNWSSFYRDESLSSNDDSLATYVNAFPLNFAGTVRSETFQSELRIASPTDGAFEYVAGAFFLHSRVQRDQKVLACQDPGLSQSTVDSSGNVITCGGYAFGWGINNPGVSGLTDLIYNREIRNNIVLSDNAAVFAQGNFRLNSHWTLTFGARWLHERQKFSLDVRDDKLANTDVRPTLLWINDPEGNRVSVNGQLIDIDNPLFGQLSGNPATNLDIRNPDSPFTTAAKSNTDRAITYKLALLYRIDRDRMVYANYSTGYKGVAWFTDSDVSQAILDQHYPIRPETSRNIELGLRSQWLDRRLTINATLFDTRFYHYQERLMTLDYDLFPQVGGGLQNIANDPTANGQPIRNYSIVDAGNLKTRGVDIDAEWQVNRAVKLSATYSYVDARFANTDALITCNAASENGADTSGCTAPINYGEFFDWTFPRRGQFFKLDGAQLANAPAHTLNADATYAFSLSDYPAYFRWNYRYASEQYTNHGGRANNDYSTTTPAYGIHNLFVGISSPDQKYRLNLFVKNLFNEHYYVYKTNYGDGLNERAVGGSPIVVPELVGIAQAYPTYGAVPNGQFFRQRAENGNILKDFNRYIGVSFEMAF